MKRILSIHQQIITFKIYFYLNINISLLKLIKNFNHTHMLNKYFVFEGVVLKNFRKII
jgi:hypothetical protein